MEYKITELKGTYDSNYPDSKKYVFRVENYDHDLSAFSKFPMAVGQEISGEIVVNGQYHNFKWGKKETASFQKGGTAPDANRLEMKIDIMLAGQKTLGAILTDIKGVMGEILSKIDGVPTDPF